MEGKDRVLKCELTLRITVENGRVSKKDILGLAAVLESKDRKYSKNMFEETKGATLEQVLALCYEMSQNIHSPQNIHSLEAKKVS